MGGEKRRERKSREEEGREGGREWERRGEERIEGKRRDEKRGRGGNGRREERGRE